MKNITINFQLTNDEIKQETVTAINIERAKDKLKSKYGARLDLFLKVVKIRTINE